MERVGWGGGGWGESRLEVFPLTPASCPSLSGSHLFVLSLLKNVMQCCKIFLHFSHFLLPGLLSPISCRVSAGVTLQWTIIQREVEILPDAWCDRNQNKLQPQSTVTLWTPCYYGQKLIQIPGRRSLTGNDSCYYGLSLWRTLNDVPRVSAIVRVDCI